MKIDRSSGHLGHHHTKMENRRGAPAEAAASTWVGRSGGPSRNGRQRCQLGGSVGRAFRPKICFAALGAAGRSVGGTESETLSTDFVGRSLETQSVLSTSLRPAATRLACRRSRSPVSSRHRAQAPLEVRAQQRILQLTIEGSAMRPHTRWRGAQPRAPAVGGSTGWPSDARRFAALPWALPTQGRDLRALSLAPRPPA